MPRAAPLSGLTELDVSRKALCVVHAHVGELVGALDENPRHVDRRARRQRTGHPG